METRHIVLTAVFAVHLAVFAAVFVRRRRPSLLLPIAVFALLIAVQVTAGSPVSGPLRVAALVLAVPSVGLMLLRIARRLRGRPARD